jgi:Tfp pilus assembly protein PilF
MRLLAILALLIVSLSLSRVSLAQNQNRQQSAADIQASDLQQIKAKCLKKIFGLDLFVNGQKQYYYQNEHKDVKECERQEISQFNRRQKSSDDNAKHISQKSNSAQPKQNNTNDKLERCVNIQNTNAINFCNEVLNTDPGNVSALFGRAQIYTSQQKYELANQDLQELVSINPKNPQTFYLIGKVKILENKNSEAIYALNTAIDLKSDFIEAYLTRGEAYLNLGSLSFATDDVDRVIKDAPSKHEAYLLKVSIFFKTGKEGTGFEEPIKYLNEAIKLKPDPKTYLFRADLLDLSGQYHQAIQDFNSAKLLLANSSENESLRKDIDARISRCLESIEFEKEIEAEEKAKEIRAKGLQYVKEANTTWQLQKDKDSISDTQNLLVISNQKSNQGTAFVQVIGRCEGKLAKFRVTILGRIEGLAPTVPDRTEFGIPIKYRIDDGEVLSFRTPNDKFSNAFVLARVSPKRSNDGYIDAKKIENQNAAQLFFGREWNALQQLSGKPDILGTLDDRNWRVLTQIETSEGPVLIKLPLYQPEVQKLINSCS